MERVTLRCKRCGHEVTARRKKKTRAPLAPFKCMGCGNRNMVWTNTWELVKKFDSLAHEAVAGGNGGR